MRYYAPLIDEDEQYDDWIAERHDEVIAEQDQDPDAVPELVLAEVKIHAALWLNRVIVWADADDCISLCVEASAGWRDFIRKSLPALSLLTNRIEDALHLVWLATFWTSALAKLRPSLSEVQ